MARSDDSRTYFWKAGVALLPLIAAGMTVPGYAQTKVDSTSPGQQPASSSAPKDDADAESQEASEQDTKTVGATEVEGEKDEQVVVTGTSIRNAPPTGTNLIAIDKEGIKATGANSAGELLANIPQAGGGFFNDIPQLEQNGQELTSGIVDKPNLRNTPSGNLDSGSSTLILLDGQRTAGTGVRQNATDVNAMPVALLERVEVNTDGGSSVYGSDGIGGVINFITRRRFDGIQVRGRYGIGDDYHNYEVGGIVGKDFGRASAYVSYSRTGNDEIFNRERDFYRVIDWSNGLQVGTECFQPNVRVGNNFYGVDANGNVSTTPGTVAAPVTANGIQSPNLCSPGEDATLVGRNVRNNALASFAYDFTDDVKLTIRGRYSDSENRSVRQPFTASVTLTPSSPFYQNLPGADAGNNQQVLFSFAPYAGLEVAEAFNRFKQYGISPELTWNLDGNWQLRVFGNWDKNRSKVDSVELNSSLLNSSVAAGLLNPYNIEDGDPALLDRIVTGVNHQEAWNEIWNARATIDGALFELPGGKVRMAAGAEYLKDKFGRLAQAGTWTEADRDTKSVFGELNIPVVSSLNSGPLFEELRFAFSARYDSYSDFGDAFSPRVGATYSPFKWLRLRGNWGKSFRAPTVVETLGVINSQAAIFPVANFTFVIPPAGTSNAQFPGGIPTTFDSDAILIAFSQGAFPDLKPQTGTNWSVAGEVRPIDGLRAELSYWKIDYRGALGSPNPLALYPAFADVPTFFPTDAQIADFVSVGTNGDQVIAGINGRQVYMLLDLRTRNVGQSKIEGLDYSARYDFDTPIGAAYINANGTVYLVNRRQAVPGAPFIDTIAGTPNHRASINVGLRSGGFRTQWTLNHTDGYKITRSANLLQDSVDAYNLVNAFFSYQFAEGELGLGRFADGLEITLNIQNVFDDAPPIFRQRGSVGFTNGNTLGRVVQLGATIDF